MTNEDPKTLPWIELIKLLFSRDCYDDVQRNRVKFRTLAKCSGSDLLDYYWRYTKKFKAAATTRKALEEFINTEESGSAEQVREEFDTAEAMPEESTDFNVALHLAYQGAEQRYMQRTTSIAGMIAVGMQDKTLEKLFKREFGEDRENWPGPAERCEIFTRQRMANNPFKDDGDAKGGRYQDNTDNVRKGLLEGFLREDNNGALLTKFPSIDDNVLIGTGFNQCRLVGIAGQSGHGKTLLLLTLAYNMASNGKNVLYVSREHGYQDTWRLMAFLHASHFQGQFTIPPISVWAQGPRAPNPVTIEDVEHLDIIQEDARSRRGLPGWVDACQYSRWDGIVAHVESNNKETPYDALFIDYVEKLDDAVSKYRQDDEYIKLMGRVKKFTQSFNGGKGMTVITPLTITKDAANQGEELDAANPEIPFRETAIRGASQILYDMDLVIGVSSTTEMIAQYQMKMWGIKKRFGRVKQPLTVLKVNP